MKHKQFLSKSLVSDKYIAESAECIEELREHFLEYKEELNFSPESLKIITSLIKKVIKKRDPFLALTEEVSLSDGEIWFITRFSYYLAEVFIRNTNEKWSFDDNKKSKTFNHYVLVWDKSKEKYNPLTTVLAGSINHFDLYDHYLFLEKKIHQE